MVSYADLNALHPSISPQRREELEALYEGGEKLEKLYTRLLPRRDRERPERYELRIKEAEYRNYLGPIIDYFKSMLFISRPVLKAKVDGAADATSDAGPYWNELREDCDLGGTDVDALFGQVLTDAMVGRTGWIRIHSPTDGGEQPNDAAEFEARKLGDCWLERLESCEVLDWDLGPDGRLLWALTHKVSTPRLGIEGGRKLVTETWEHLTRETVEAYSITYERDKKPKPDDAIVRLGQPVPHPFGAVPLICLDLPPALWVGNRLRSPQLAHFRKLNAHSWSISATCYAMREYFVSDPDAFSEQIHGAGYEVILHKDDKAQWSSPDGGHFSAAADEVKTEKDEIFRVAHQMALGVENNAAAVGRSAESKASDAESTRVVLVAFSRRVKECIEYVFDLIARARGEKIDWSVEGLDDFAAFDITSFLEQLGLVKAAGGIPSRTFEIQSKTRLAEALLKDCDEQTKATMRKEIEDGAVDPTEQRELENAVALGMFGPADAEPDEQPKRLPKKAPTKPRASSRSGEQSAE